MATSPNTTLTSPKKKDESILEKIGTLGRKKKVKEGKMHNFHCSNELNHEDFPSPN
jgi:hypothetical protein